MARAVILIIPMMMLFGICIVGGITMDVEGIREDKKINFDGEIDSLSNAVPLQPVNPPQTPENPLLNDALVRVSLKQLVDDGASKPGRPFRRKRSREGNEETNPGKSGVRADLSLEFQRDNSLSHYFNTPVEVESLTKVPILDRIQPAEWNLLIMQPTEPLSPTTDSDCGYHGYSLCVLPVDPAQQSVGSGDRKLSGDAFVLLCSDGSGSRGGIRKVSRQAYRLWASGSDGYTYSMHDSRGGEDPSQEPNSGDGRLYHGRARPSMKLKITAGQGFSLYPYREFRLTDISIRPYELDELNRQQQCLNQDTKFCMLNGDFVHLNTSDFLSAMKELVTNGCVREALLGESSPLHPADMVVIPSTGACMVPRAVQSCQKSVSPIADRLKTVEHKPSQVDWAWQPALWFF